MIPSFDTGLIWPSKKKKKKKEYKCSISRHSMLHLHTSILPWKKFTVYTGKILVEDISLWFGCQSTDTLSNTKLYGGHQLPSGFLYDSDMLN